MVSFKESPVKGAISSVEQKLQSLRMPQSPTRGAASPPRSPLRHETGGCDQDETTQIISNIESLNIGRPTDKENWAPNHGQGNNHGHVAANNTHTPSWTSRDYEKFNDPQTKRLVNVTQLYFFDYYFDLLTYVHGRQQRLGKAKTAIAGVPREEAETQWKSYVGRERAHLRKRRTRLKHGDFQILTQVGQGGYGQVFLAKKADTREICALKVLNKKLLLKLDEIRHILTERDILTAARSEWLVKLLYAFQDQESVYLAMEFVPGGDYRTLLNNTGILNPRHARFYISEMFASLEALHKLGYIHRDLKPENFLIDSAGHIKLTDFGLASGAISKDRVESMKIRLDAVKDVQVTHRSLTERQKMYRSLRSSDINYASSIVGSPDYMALEVLEGKNYDYTIDYWSLGCMLFETLAGYPPFAGASPDETYSNLRQWKNALRRPKYDDGRYVFSDRTWDLIQRLITSARYRLRSFDEIAKHPYFAEVEWETLRQKTPPFIPQLDSDVDAGYFDDFSNEADMEKYQEVMAKRTQVENLADKGNPIPHRAFVGFTFRHSRNPNNNILEETNKANNAHGRREVRSNFGTMF